MKYKYYFWSKVKLKKPNGKSHQAGRHALPAAWLMVSNHSKVVLLNVFTMTSKSVNDIVLKVISHIIGQLVQPMKFQNVNPNGPFLIGDHVRSLVDVVLWFGQWTVRRTDHVVWNDRKLQKSVISELAQLRTAKISSVWEKWIWTETTTLR